MNCRNYQTSTSGLFNKNIQEEREHVLSTFSNLRLIVKEFLAQDSMSTISPSTMTTNVVNLVNLKYVNII